MRVAVVGAGITGLVCAGDLVAAGHDVAVFERARGVGGRASHCRPGPSGQPVDHGAPYFTVRDAGFGAVVARLAAAGAARVWCDRFETWDGAAHPAPAATAGYARWCMPGGMGNLAAALSRGIDVRREHRVDALRRSGTSVALEIRGGAPAGPFDGVVLAMPAPLAAALVRTLAPGDAVLEALDDVAMHPVLALAAGYPLDASPAWRAYVVTGRSALTWLAHDSSKRTSPAECVLVGHASPQWSATRYEDPPEALAGAMMRLLAGIAGAWAARPAWVGLHLWRYAIPPTPLGAGALASATAPLVACGEWSAGARVEGAYLAGKAAARQILR